MAGFSAAGAVVVGLVVVAAAVVVAVAVVVVVNYCRVFNEGRPTALEARSRPKQIQVNILEMQKHR